MRSARCSWRPTGAFNRRDALASASPSPSKGVREAAAFRAGERGRGLQGMVDPLGVWPLVAIEASANVRFCYHGRSAVLEGAATLCGRGGIGRRAGLRIRWATLQVQVLSPAPALNSLNFFVIKRMFGLFCFIEEFEKFRK